jgi:hypothetical protein
MSSGGRGGVGGALALSHSSPDQLTLVTTRSDRLFFTFGKHSQLFRYYWYLYAKSLSCYTFTRSDRLFSTAKILCQSFRFFCDLYAKSLSCYTFLPQIILSRPNPRMWLAIIKQAHFVD